MRIKTILFVVCFILPLKIKFSISAKVFAQNLIVYGEKDTKNEDIEIKFQEEIRKLGDQEKEKREFIKDYWQAKKEIREFERQEEEEIKFQEEIRKQKEQERAEIKFQEKMREQEGQEKEEEKKRSSWKEREQKQKQSERIKELKRGLSKIAENLYKELELIYSLNIESALDTLETFKNIDAKKISILFDKQKNYNNAKLKLFILNNFPIDEKNNLVFGVNLFATENYFIKHKDKKYYEDDNYYFNFSHNSASFNLFFSHKNDYFNTNILFNFNKQVSENIESKFTFKIKTFNLSYGIDIPIYDRLNVGLDAIYNLFIIQNFKYQLSGYSSYKTPNIILVPSAKFKLMDTRYKDIFDINLNLNTQYSFLTRKNRGNSEFYNEFLTLSVEFPQINRNLFKFGTSLDVKILDKFSVILSLDKHYTKTKNYLEYRIKMKYDFDD